MLTREERAKAEELFGLNPDATREDVERALGRSANGMIEAVELGILQKRAKDEAKARPEEAAKKPGGGAERSVRVRITVDLTIRDNDDLSIRIRSCPAELSDREDLAMRVRAAVLKLVARRAVDEISDTLDNTWLDDAMLGAMHELKADFEAAKRRDD